jgi:hypothetical protein
MKVDLSPEWQVALRLLVEQCKHVCQLESRPSYEHVHELRQRGLAFEAEGGLTVLTKNDIRLVEKRNGE